MVPTKDRNHSGLYISHSSENILIDCGENIQRQMKIAKIKPSQIKRILISHWHGDHVLGLPGLIQTMSATMPGNKLNIYGPVGTENFLNHVFQSSVFENQLDIKIHEIDKSRTIVDTQALKIKAYELDHKIPCIGFKVIEKDTLRINRAFVDKHKIPEGPLFGKLQLGQDIEFNGKTILSEDATITKHGKKIGVITDTVLCNNCYKIGEDVDLLISESTYAYKLKNKAIEYFHMTAREAAEIALQNNVSQLVLTHLSQRYKFDDEILDDAKELFDNVIVAYDFLKIKI